MTVWRRQADGNYKAVIDFGISHDKPASVETSWKSPNYVVKSVGENKPVASNAANSFFDAAAEKGLSNAYKTFAADDVRLLRDGRFPILGKENAISEAKKEKSKIAFGSRMTMQSAGDFAYRADDF